MLFDHAHWTCTSQQLWTWKHLKLMLSLKKLIILVMESLQIYLFISDSLSKWFNSSHEQNKMEKMCIFDILWTGERCFQCRDIICIKKKELFFFTVCLCTCFFIKIVMYLASCGIFVSQFVCFGLPVVASYPLQVFRSTSPNTMGESSMIIESGPEPWAANAHLKSVDENKVFLVEQPRT